MLLSFRLWFYVIFFKLILNSVTIVVTKFFLHRYKIKVIMASKMEQILPDYHKYTESQIKGGIRTVTRVTFNPSSAKPGQEIYIAIPKLGQDICIVPGSLCLVANFKNDNTKSWFLQNLGRLLCDRLMISFDAQTVYENLGEGMYGVYQDLWKTEAERKNLAAFGVHDENVRKLMSADDSASSSNAVDNGIFACYGKTVKIRLGKILNDHGLYARYGMNSELRYKLTLPDAKKIMVAQTSENVDGYELTDIQLEYDTIRNADMYAQSLQKYSVGRSLSYQHVTLLETREWDKAATLITENINIPRHSISAIVMLFKEKGDVTDSEKFVYPNLEQVDVTIEGMPSQVYNRGILKSDFFHEAKRFMQTGDDALTVDKFITDNKFALVVDLRSFAGQDIVGSGRKILNTQNGVLLEIKKKATTKNIMCHIFIASDAFVNVVGKSIQSVNY